MVLRLWGNLRFRGCRGSEFLETGCPEPSWDVGGIRVWGPLTKLGCQMDYRGIMGFRVQGLGEIYRNDLEDSHLKIQDFGLGGYYFFVSAFEGV